MEEKIDDTESDRDFALYEKYLSNRRSLTVSEIEKLKRMGVNF